MRTLQRTVKTSYLYSKKVSVYGGLAPITLCPWTLLGAQPAAPVYIPQCLLFLHQTQGVWIKRWCCQQSTVVGCAQSHCRGDKTETWGIKIGTKCCVRPMSHLQFYRATLSRNFTARQSCSVQQRMLHTATNKQTKQRWFHVTLMTILWQSVYSIK